jgi:hypothetical protein
MFRHTLYIEIREIISKLHVEHVSDPWPNHMVKLVPSSCRGKSWLLNVVSDSNINKNSSFGGENEVSNFQTIGFRMLSHKPIWANQFSAIPKFVV